MCDVTLELGVLVHVPDARADPRFAASPWVDGRRGQVRFYASAPVLGAVRPACSAPCARSTSSRTA